MGAITLRRRFPSKLPDGYTDALAGIAERMAHLDPYSIEPETYEAIRDGLIMDLARVAAEYG